MKGEEKAEGRALVEREVHERGSERQHDESPAENGDDDLSLIHI